MSKGTHDHADDPRNADIRININRVLLPRAEAVVPVFDPGFMLGEGVREGLRLHDGGLPFSSFAMTRCGPRPGTIAWAGSPAAT